MSNNEDLLDIEAAGAAEALANVQTLWFSQPLDHDNDSIGTFQQRYYVNPEFYKEGSPAFLYLGGEGELRNSTAARGIIYDMAREHNAIIYSLEHRYYGLSQPFDILTADNLQYLSSLNGVKDAGYFMRNVINPLTNKTLENVRWITVGGSYPGSLSAWIREEYPDLVFAALASSAPVFAKENFYEYDQVVAAALGKDCFANIEEVKNYIDVQFSITGNRKKLKEDLGCMDITNDIAFVSTIFDILASVVQYNSPTAKPNISGLCGGFANTTAIEDKYNYFISQLKVYLQSENKSCYKFADFDSLYNLDAKSGSVRQWTYQCCTEYGYWQTAPPDHSTRSKLLTADWFNDFYCSSDIFGKKIGPPNTRFINSRFRALENRVKRTIWVNGETDPWVALSVHNISESTPDRPIYIVKQGSHAQDLGSTRATDSESLTETRKSIRADISRWLSE
ncbi:peptidase S28 [Conidiobolus coronatus NRRL 28638]|uniref:Peptidase S28 n=1 Tax=Conidiobolus coronatus (strain ATCC 28846 / CBS 209.66 / NRRL 28638) TaxID=796925 RepID=A0A137P8E0_CONC2|nr:peptidase S28 [Conidiobolus coronatus NRRL 28638]|eukprot:KXN71214.1 peptidase S28 [Conidiobolus coronatus NRRL 28638]